MSDTKRKQPSTLALVIIIIALTVGGSIVLANKNSYYSTTAAGDALPLNDIIFENNQKLYSFKLGETPKAIQPAPLKPKEELLYFGEKKYAVAENADGVYFKGSDDKQYKLEIENIDIDSLKLSADEKCFLAFSDKNLYLINIKNDDIDSYIPMDNNVDAAFFTGRVHDVAYIKDNGLFYSSGGYKSQIAENVKAIATANDGMDVFYIKDFSAENGGTLAKYVVGSKNNKETQKGLDTNVTDMVYYGDNTLIYIKNGKIHSLVNDKITDLGIEADSIKK